VGERAEGRILDFGCGCWGWEGGAEMYAGGKRTYFVACVQMEVA